MSWTSSSWGPAPRAWNRGELRAGIAQVDRDRLALALDALVDNAVKHTNPGDRIELSASRRNGTILLAVSDWGSGVPPDNADRIFDRVRPLPGNLVKPLEKFQAPGTNGPPPLPKTSGETGRLL